jgi:hypothetical protein
VAHHLFIVSRHEPGLFSYLSREFAGEPGVTVIIDRRQGERRTGHEQETETAVDRRQADRRHRGELVDKLSTLGYAFVRLA